MHPSKYALAFQLTIITDIVIALSGRHGKWRHPRSGSGVRIAACVDLNVRRAVLMTFVGRRRETGTASPSQSHLKCRKYAIRKEQWVSPRRPPTVVPIRPGDV